MSCTFRAIVAGLLLTSCMSAQSVVSMTPLRDNTLYDDRLGAISNGRGSTMFIGLTGELRVTRALLAFDVVANVPLGSTILSAEIELHVTRTGVMVVDLHRMSDDWGEGTSIGTRGGGAGAPATVGDATWLHRFYPSSTWSVPGGDFVASPSSTAMLGASDVLLTMPSTPTMIADVQAMLDQPGSNHGWMLRGDETTSARRFETRESSVDMRPILRLTYDAPLATATAFGTTCAMAAGSTPVFAASAPPVIGTTFSLRVTDIPSTSQFVAVLFSFGPPRPAIDLTPIGMPNCQFLANGPETVTLFRPWTAPSLDQPLTVPADASLAGLQVVTQAFTGSPPATPLGWIATNGVLLRLGR